MHDGIDVMGAADYQQVAALWEEVEMWPHVGEDRDWYKSALARNPGCAFVWRQEDRVVGTVVGAWDGLRGWIYHLAVTESLPRAGDREQAAGGSGRAAPRGGREADQPHGV